MSDRRGQSILRLKAVSLQASVGSDFLLHNISWELKQGSKVAVVGASGAGKTSLLRLLNRLASPTKGKIFIRDLPAKRLTTTQLRRQIVLAPQEPKLLGMKVIDALGYPLRLQKLPESEIRQRIETWVNLIRIPDEWFDKTELQLSLGQRQLVGIARSLVMQPEVLLLDEPTSALDIGTATHVFSVLGKLNQSQNLTIVMVNHQLELLVDFCDRILFLNEGRLEEDLPANDTNWDKLRQKILRSHSEQEQEWS
ncbi:ATP-binding cassette domain-containing protein [Waterburya agarophytonicola K14]|uniref:ATP-binding cassette domain-containing protein n=1 Tax=Waterburya agarophytonicola KI4 TaxID=2874699 RepID=A0A964BUU9_9CYAN|nr:ATP-binding cassette domain-containing protein [Waterburya agarophytonicola]MCC0179211.1 ATP-binding cassette domain-containing protein [Waterburya agarophytonicola KI4]